MNRRLSTREPPPSPCAKCHKISGKSCLRKGFFSLLRCSNKSLLIVACSCNDRRRRGRWVPILLQREMVGYLLGWRRRLSRSCRTLWTTQYGVRCCVPSMAMGVRGAWRRSGGRFVPSLPANSTTTCRSSGARVRLPRCLRTLARFRVELALPPRFPTTDVCVLCCGQRRSGIGSGEKLLSKRTAHLS